jgi:dynein heavy chain
MIIAMSPLGEIFRKRLRQFPSLVTCCTLDWFTEWPEEALLGVGKGQITAGDTDLGKDLDKCVETFKFIHQSVEKASEEYKESLQRINYVTPTSFLEQLEMYKVILKQTRESTLTAKNRLVRGLQVLQEAATEIAKLQKTINEMAPELEKTKKELATTLEIVAKEKADADVEKAKVAIEEEDAR